MKTIKTILFPSDFSDNSVVAWKYGLLYSEKHEAKVVVVHVVHRMPQDYRFLIMAGSPANSYGGLRERAEQQMTQLVKEAGRNGVRFDVLNWDGEPSV